MPLITVTLMERDTAIWKEDKLMVEHVEISDNRLLVKLPNQEYMEWIATHQPGFGLDDNGYWLSRDNRIAYSDIKIEAS